MAESSVNLYKKSLDKAFSGVGLNTGTMMDHAKYSQGMKEDKSEDTPMIKRSINKFLHAKKKETKEQENEFSEEWSEKYKKSINCSNPKGFSQKAHCQGRKKKETKEATGSGSSGAYSGPVFGGDDAFWERSRSENPKIEEQVEKVEAKEATTSGSVGGYESPSMWAKSTKKKDWGPSRKTQIPGGGFVKIKKKCTKFPYCNQGDINALNLTENPLIKKIIKTLSTEYNINESSIKKMLIQEMMK